MKAFAHHFAFEFRAGIRNKTSLMLNYLFPLGFYLIMGFVMPSINPPFRETIIPAMVVFGALSATLLGIPDPLVNARERGVFRSYKINGVPSASILAIPAMTTGLHLLILSAIITATAPLLFDAPLPTNWLFYAMIILVLIPALASLSLLIGVVSPNSRTTVLWSQLVFLPSMLLGGLMMPLSALPKAAARVAQLLPATQAMNAFGALTMGQETVFPAWLSLLALGLSAMLGFALAIYLFSWDSHNTTRRAHPALALLVLLPYAITALLA